MATGALLFPPLKRGMYSGKRKESKGRCNAAEVESKGLVEGR
jgi:hypothetical protein